MIVDARLGNPVSVRKAIRHLKLADPALAAVIGHVGPFRMEFRPPTFWTLARSIVFQQLNGRAAAAIFDRLEKACGEISPEAVLRLRPARLRAAGLSEQKAGYLRNLARHAAAGNIVIEQLATLSDQEIIARLTQVKGIGVWTAHMFLIFGLQRPDVLPTGDYGVRQAMARLYSLPSLPKPREMSQIAQPWRPWASVASWYLWRSLDVPVEL
jgi:DNA-3-methyladenine glycosylase II